MSEEKIQEYGMAIRIRNRLEMETGKIFEIVNDGGCYVVREYKVAEC